MLQSKAFLPVLLFFSQGCFAWGGFPPVVDERPSIDQERTSTQDPVEKDAPESGRRAYTSSSIKSLQRCARKECGPRPTCPLKLCPDGISQSGCGPCMQLPDGKCGWVRLQCPQDSQDVEPIERVEKIEQKEEPPHPPKPVRTQSNVYTFKSCSDLPGSEELKSWKIHRVYDRPCPFGPDNLKYPWWIQIKDLGDGTFIGKDEQRGCIRLKVRRCLSK